MNHKYLLCLSLAVFVGAALYADDYRWIKGTFTWKGNGTMITQVVPLYGETYRVNYASPQKGPLSITVLDAATKKPLPPKELLKSRQVLQPGSKSADGLQFAMLVIEGDGRPWEVRLDQCLTSVQEWRLKGVLEEQKKPATKLGVWAGTGSEKIVFTAQNAPWKLHVIQETEGNVVVTVTSDDAKLYYSTQLNSAGQEGEGWITVAGPVTVSVTASDTDWTIEAEKRQ
ncbi:MAG: hypothetical protein II943_05005 [Victivallales bacterium]|nr:hypothetical protein [Victivallales bacterium]